jgi:hypothetical protein
VIRSVKLFCSESRPNNAFEPTLLCGERDRADFESWIRLDSIPALAVRRGSMLAVGPQVSIS